MKSFIILMMVLLTSAAGWAQDQPAQTTQRQEQPTPPALVLERARRFGRVLGKPVAAQPSGVGMEAAEYTGHALWGVGWSQGKRGFAMTVNQATGRVVKFRDTTDIEAVREAFRSDKPCTVTEEQAVSTVKAALRQASAASGDWRVTETTLSEWTPGMKSWQIWAHRYVDGKPCDLERVYSRVNPYTGDLQYFSLQDSGIRLAQNAPLISETQARQIAAAVWRQFGGPDDIEPRDRWGGPCWLRFSQNSPLCRLAYEYHFEIKEKGELVVAYGAIVDAETGEVWTVGSVTGGAGKFRSRPVPTSPRIALAAELARNTEAAPLVRAVVSGTPLKSAKQTAKERRLQYRVSNRDVEFAWISDKQELTWREGTGSVAGVRLSADEAARLDAWFRSRSK